MSERADFPAYTDALVCLARSYDRARMATEAVEWLFSDLRDPNGQAVSYVTEFAVERVGLLRDQLKPMSTMLGDMIIAESRSHFVVSRDASGELKFPDTVAAMMASIDDQILFYKDGDEAQALEKASAYRDSHYLILWAGDCHLLPKTYPKAFFEAWWPFFWVDAAVLVEKPDYGWLVCHHEL